MAPVLTVVEVDSGEVVGGDDGSGSTRARPPVLGDAGGVDGEGRLGEARMEVGSAAAESEAGGKRRLSTTAA